MLHKVARYVGLGLAGVAFAGPAFAEDVNVTTAADSAKLGGEFRSEFRYSNNGLQKTKGVSPDSASNFEVQAAKIKLKGKLNPATEYAFRFSLWGSAPAGTVAPASTLDYGYGSYWFTKMVGFSIGKMKVLQGGWDNMDATEYREHVRGAYLDNMAYSIFSEALAFHLNAGTNQVTLQLLNDSDSNAGATSRFRKSSNEHPTYAIGYRGNFGGISPLLNLGSYDDNKSMWVDVGVKAEIAGVNAKVDFMQRQDKFKVAKTTGTGTEEKGDTLQSITVSAAYEVKNVVAPWVYVSTFSRSEEKGSIHYAGTEETKINTITDVDADKDGTPESKAYSFNDNGMVWGVGANVLSMGKGWTPYLAIINKSGDFQKTGEAANKTENRSEMWVRLGVLGEI